MTGFLESALVFLAGLLARLALMILVMAVFAVPILLALKTWGGATAVWQRAHGLRRVAGLAWRSGLRYAPGHTWVQANGRLRVGLDGLAQRILGEASEVMLPPEGLEVHTGEVVATISCGERRAPIVSPVNGRVAAVNRTLLEDPARATRDPYRAGWLFSVWPADRSWESLPSGEAARQWFRGEAERLHRLLEGHLGLAAADGGELLLPPASALPDAEWRAVTDAFLKSA